MMMPIHFIRKSCLIFCASLLALTIPALATKTADTDTPDPNVGKVANANTDFGFRLLSQLNKATPDKNIFFSPFSVSNCLTMVLNGAGGQTQSEMTTTLGLNAMTLDQINQANGLLLPSLATPVSGSGVKISIANALWANTGTTFNPDFEQRCRTFYNARTATLDFSAPAATDTINSWVKDNTAGKIDKLVTPGDLNQATAVLTNAVYFEGRWEEVFHKEDTQEGHFTLTSGHSKTISMMSRSGAYPYLKTSQFQAVSLPYGTGRLSLEIFLPQTGTTLDDFLKELNGTAWTQWITQMKRQSMTLLLPRFKADYTTTLNAPLMALGMATAFSPSADFAPMGLKDSLISKVIHKAIVQVDEQGTVAAAATGTIMSLSAHMPPQFVLRIDHPFFMAIRDNTTGTLLFAGVIRDPK